MTKRAFIATLFWVLALMPAGASRLYAEDILAVLSSNSPPYLEALKGVELTLGHPVPRIIMTSDNLPPGTASTVIVAIGGRAASRLYSPESTVIYCLSPGLILHQAADANRRIKVPVCSRPEVMIQGMKRIQPGLKRLAIVRISPNFAAHFKHLHQDALRYGVDTIEIFLTSGDELPDRLRALKGKADALWMAPDPLLITPAHFSVVKEFARANNMPLYVPMDNLVDKGAMASVVPSFQDMGNTAGQLAQAALDGTLTGEDTVYSEKSHVTLNLTVAAQSGLILPVEAVKTAERVVP